MRGLGLLVLSVAAIGVLQLTAYYYLCRRVATTEEPRAEGPPAPFSLDRGWNLQYRADPESPQCRCPACGATNHAEYTYCQHCLQQLPSSTS